MDPEHAGVAHDVLEDHGQEHPHSSTRSARSVPAGRPPARAAARLSALDPPSTVPAFRAEEGQLERRVRIAVLAGRDFEYGGEQMRRPIRLRHIPARLITGAYILNEGLTKREAGEDTAARLHGMAKGTYPALGELEPKDFLRLLSAGEIAVGTLLLVPVVPTALAGGALAGFAGALLGLYLRTPGMRKEGSLRPTPQGTTLSKDSWLLGIGLTLLLDGLTDRKRPPGKSPARPRATDTSD